jgi:hypothetical protein
MSVYDRIEDMANQSLRPEDAREVAAVMKKLRLNYASVDAHKIVEMGEALDAKLERVKQEMLEFFATGYPGEEYEALAKWSNGLFYGPETALNELLSRYMLKVEKE